MATTRITLVTYNVWFGEYFPDERRAALMRILRAADADIIGLQEVTPGLLAYLRAQDWLRDGYHFAEVSVSPYGVMVLSRRPVQRFVEHPLPTRMGRSLVLAELEDLAVGVVHLESLSYAETRRRQLEKIFPILDEYPHAVLMGDFNMCSTWDENRHLDSRFVDIWPALHGDDPGWTEDTDINTMRLLVKSKRTQVRFDRIILRSADERWRPFHIERLGTEPVSPEFPEVFPSDHFGLRARLERAAETERTDEDESPAGASA